jgi:hypothetical protein
MVELCVFFLCGHRAFLGKINRLFPWYKAG